MGGFSDESLGNWSNALWGLSCFCSAFTPQLKGFTQVPCMCKYLPVTHCICNCLRPAGWQSPCVTAGILWWPKMKGSKIWRCCWWEDGELRGVDNLFLVLRTSPLHFSADQSKTYHWVWFPTTLAVLLDWEAGMPNLCTQWSMEWLRHVSSPLWARPSFGLNWDSSITSCKAMLICTSWESVPWFSKPIIRGHILILGVLWGLRDALCSTALRGEWLLTKPQLGFGLFWPARCRHPFCFPVGPSHRDWCWTTSYPCSLGVDMAGYSSPASLGAMWAWILQFTKRNPYLCAKWAMQRYTGLKKKEVWRRGWISFLLKHLLAKSPFSVIFQC